MIKRIKINNFLTIKDIEINFSEHFNVITGESGAGKSLILKAINEIFKAKNNTQMIGNFSDCAQISIDFNADLSKYGFKENSFTLTKILKKNKAQLFLNSNTINNLLSQNLKNDVINIVSQDYRFELFEKDKFIEVLDLFVTSYIIETYKNLFTRFNNIKKTIQTIENEISSLNNLHPELLIDLIEKINPQENEYDQLIDKRKQLKQNLAIKDSILQLNNLFYEDQNSFYNVIVSTLKKTNSIESKNIQLLNQSLNKILDEMITIKPLLSINTDSEISIDNIEKRLYELETLQRKFGKTINEILIEKQKLLKIIASKQSLQDKLQKEKENLKEAQTQLLIAAGNLSMQRRNKADYIVKNVKKYMSELLLESAEFEIVFEKCEFTDTGQDKITLLFSANRDLPKKELSKVASGGEKSRFILALIEHIGDLNKKTILLDEIEEGTGGKTLFAIMSKLQKISLKNQLICITHSIDIQNTADKIFKIEKTFENSNTITYLCQDQM